MHFGEKNRVGRKRGGNATRDVEFVHFWTRAGIAGVGASIEIDQFNHELVHIDATEHSEHAIESGTDRSTEVCLEDLHRWFVEEHRHEG